MKILLTYTEALLKCNNWDDLCEKIGLNPWCIKEGLVDGEAELELDYEIAKEYGIVKEGI